MKIIENVTCTEHYMNTFSLDGTLSKSTRTNMFYLNVIFEVLHNHPLCLG